MARVPDIDDSPKAVQHRLDLQQNEHVTLIFNGWNIPIHTQAELQITNTWETVNKMTRVTSGKFGDCLLREVSCKDLILADRTWESLSNEERKDIGDDIRNRGREVDLAPTLNNHQHILRISAFVSEDRNPKTVIGVLTEYAPNVEQFFEEVPTFPAEEWAMMLWRWAHQLSILMAYLVHDFQILHRGIRPENVFVFDGGARIKLGNFYNARRADPSENHSKLKKDLRYRAPETLGKEDGRPLVKYSFSSDVYSFGMFLYYITHGRHPFENERSLGHEVKFRKRLEGRGEEPLRPVLTEHPDFHRLILFCWRTELRDDEGNIMEEVPLRCTFSEIKDYIAHNHPY